MHKKIPAAGMIGLTSLVLILGVGAGVRMSIVRAEPQDMGMRSRGMGGPSMRDPGMYAPGPPRDERAYRSPFDLAFSPDGRLLAVSDRTARCLYVFDARTNDLARTIPLRGRPSGLAWASPDKVAVCEYDAGTVAEVDATTGQVSRRFFVGPKPIGVGIAVRKGLLVVCDFGLHTVSIVDLKTAALRASVPAGRYPHCVAITPDERTAVIANLLPSGSAAEHASTSLVSLIDLDGGTKIADVPLPDNSANVRQVRISPDGRWAYLVHTRGRTMLPTTQLDRGWVNTNAMSIIDLAAGSEKGRSGLYSSTKSPGSISLKNRDDGTSDTRPGFEGEESKKEILPPQSRPDLPFSDPPRATPELYATVLLDTVTEGAADPWGIALSPDGTAAWISLAGAHQIARIELARLHDLLGGRGDQGPKPDSTATDATTIWREIQEDPTKRAQLSYHLSALYAAGLMSRTPIAAQGPRSIAISPDGGQLVVASYFSGEVLVVDPNRCQIVKRIGLGPQPAPDVVRHGEFVFHDGRHSFQSWLSCASCHPDGRADGMNWDLLNDGIGNPKNTHSLLWSHRTPPLMSLGIRENMEEATQKGFQFIQFREVEEGDLNAVRAYLRSLEPEPSPHLVNGSLSDKARKGRQIFESHQVGCSACHPAPLFTTLKTYDVGTRSTLDRSGAFDTPTLVEPWRTAPYLHDGSAVALKDVMTTKNPGDKHGRTSHLSEEEIDALVEYLLSL